MKIAYRGRVWYAPIGSIYLGPSSADLPIAYFPGRGVGPMSPMPLPTPPKEPA